MATVEQVPDATETTPAATPTAAPAATPAPGSKEAADAIAKAEFDPADVEKTLDDAINHIEGHFTQTKDDVKEFHQQNKEKAEKVINDLKTQDAEAKKAAAVDDAAEAVKDYEKATLAAAEAEAEAGALSEKVEVSAESDESESETEEDDDDDSDWEDDFDPDETLGERLEALKDILTPETRSVITSAVSKTTSAVTTVAHTTGTTLWYVSTTMMLLGVPLALSILSETQLTELEKEMNMQQQGGDILTPSA